MVRSQQLVVPIFALGALLSWSSQASASVAAQEAPGVLKTFKCDETTVSEAIDVGDGDWNYRYTTKCWVTYVPKVSEPRDKGWGLAGPEPAGEPESMGQVLITGVGIYRAKTNTAVDNARIEGNIVHRVTDVVYALDLGVQSKYRCTRDPFLYQSGAVCTQKAMNIQGEGWSQLKMLTHRRQVPFGTWGITLAVRNQIGKKGKPIPPPPPPTPKNDEEKNTPSPLDPGQQHQPEEGPTPKKKKPRKKTKKRVQKSKKRIKKTKRKTKQRGG